MLDNLLASAPDCNSFFDLSADLRKYSRLKSLGAQIASTAFREIASETLDLSRDKLGTAELASKLERLGGCACNLIYHKRLGDKPKWRLHSGAFCQQGDACPVCAKRIQGKRVARFKSPIMRAAEGYRHAYLVTLTVRNSDDLRDSLDDLQGSLLRLRRRAQKRCGKFGNFAWSPVADGGSAILSIEVKRGKNSHQWHPHAHAIVFSDKKMKYHRNNVVWQARMKSGKERYFTRDDYYAALDFAGHDGEIKPFCVSDLGKEWIEVTGGESCNVDIRPIRGDGKKGSKKWSESVFTQCLEIFKYNTKIFTNGVNDETGEVVPEIFSLSDLALVSIAGFRRRKFVTYGKFRDRESEYYAGQDSWEADPVDGKEIEIYKTKYDYRRAAYGSLERVDRAFDLEKPFDDIRKKRLSAQAKILGEFARKKSAILKHRQKYIESGALNEMDREISRALRERNDSLKSLRDDVNIETQIRMGDGRKNVYVDKVWQKHLESETPEAKALREFAGGCEIQNHGDPYVVPWGPSEVPYINNAHA